MVLLAKIVKAMEVKGDFWYVCVPLTAGVFAAAAISSLWNKFSAASCTAAGVVFCLVCICAYLAVSDKVLRHNLPFWLTAFFLAGMMCRLGDCAAGWNDTRNTFLLREGEQISALIDSIPFAEAQDNALAKALITGDRSSLSNATKTAFRDAGAAHMLALSGMHLGVIYLIVRWALSIFGNSPRISKIRSIAIICLTGAYTAMCGAGASLLRAWLFITLYESGKILSRPQNGGHVLCAALTIHLILRPSDAEGLGFQLSYLAMIGIVFIWPYMRKWYKGEDIGKKIWDTASLSLSCQLFTAPLTLLHFGTFPVYFLITNLLGSLLLSVVIVCIIVAMTLCYAGMESSMLVSWAEYPVSALRWLMETVSSLPGFQA